MELGYLEKKYYKSERNIEGQVAHNFWGHNEFGSNQDASKEVIAIGVVFDNPKPSKLIKSVIQIFSNKKFHCIRFICGFLVQQHKLCLTLTKKMEENRKFILVECEDYADKITAERVRRVMKGVPKAKDDKLKKGLGGSFTYCTLGEEINTVNLLKGKKLTRLQTAG